MLDNLDFHVGETLHQLELSALVGEGLHKLHVQILKGVHNLDFNVGETLYNLHFAVKVEGLAVFGDEGAIVFVDARLLVVRLRHHR